MTKVWLTFWDPITLAIRDQKYSIGWIVHGLGKCPLRMRLSLNHGMIFLIMVLAHRLMGK